MDRLKVTPLWHAENIFCPTCDSVMAQLAKIKSQGVVTYYGNECYINVNKDL